jgi:hypothetical protein
MASGDVSQLTQIEVLRQTARARIARFRLPGLVVIRKEPLGPDAERRVRHEIAMLERLRGLEGVAQLVDAPSARSESSIVLADAGAATLRDCPNRSRSTSCSRSHRPWPARSRACTAAA